MSRLCLLLRLPPIHVSSATIVPRMVWTSPSPFMVSRMRCIMNHAVRGQRPYLRSISRAETPFLDEHISKITNTHLRTLILVPWNGVPVSTENCLRHSPHRQTRRSLMAPVRVLRLTPFDGRMKSAPTWAQWGHVGVPVGQRSSSKNS